MELDVYIYYEDGCWHIGPRWTFPATVAPTCDLDMLKTATSFRYRDKLGQWKSVGEVLLNAPPLMQEKEEITAVYCYSDTEPDDCGITDVDNSITVRQTIWVQQSGTYNHSGKVSNFSYVGEVDERGLKHGHGTYQMALGLYEGQFQNDMRHGHGKMTWLDGGTYDGGWVNDERIGLGSFYQSSGALKYNFH